MWCIIFVLFWFISLVYCNENRYGVIINENRFKSLTYLSSENDEGTYEFYDGETLEIFCYKPKNFLGKKAYMARITSNVYINNMKPAYLQGKKTVFMYLKMTPECDRKYIKCDVSDATQNKKHHTTIYFKLSNRKVNSRAFPSLKDLLDIAGASKFPFLYYLTMSNILGIYYEDKYKLTILYEFYNEPKIKLYCDSKLWEDKIGVRISNEEFEITSSDYALVSCTYTSGSGFKYTTQVRFVFREPRPTTAAPTTTTVATTTTTVATTPVVVLTSVAPKPTVTTSNMTTTTLATLSKASTDKPDKIVTVEPDSRTKENEGFITYNKTKTDPQLMYIIIGLSALSTILLFALILVWISKKKPPISSDDTNIHYESLPEHNQGTMPMPSQWRDLQYAVPADRIGNADYAVPFKPNIEDMYTKPVPKSQRTLQKSLENDSHGYSSIDDVINVNKTASNNTKVATVGKPHSATRNLGQKVLPTNVMYADLAVRCKNKSKISDNGEFVSIKTIPSDTGSESPYAEMNYEDGAYAQIGAKTNPGYENVFDGKRYENISTKKEDYAEPAYCELNNG